MDASLAVTTADGVEFRLTVTNDETEPIELTFRDSGLADFAVLEEGTEVWRWSDGRMFAQVIGHERLEPGESATFDAEWPDPSPGEYTAVAELRVTDRAVTARRPFSV